MTRMIAVTLLALFATTRDFSSVEGSSQVAPTSKPVAPVVRVYPSDTPGLIAPVAIEAPNPPFTREAFDGKVQGTLLLDVTVGADGRVRDAMVTRSLDTTYGTDERAIATLSQWRFEPGKLGGQPVAVRTAVTFMMMIGGMRFDTFLESTALDIRKTLASLPGR
jgi:TonB family protein